MLGRVCQFFSRTQKSVALSSTEAEYVALAAGIKETFFFFFYGISGGLSSRTATLDAL